MSKTPDGGNAFRWWVSTLITLLAAGGGVTSWFGLFSNHVSPPPKPKPDPIILPDSPPRNNSIVNNYHDGMKNAETIIKKNERERCISELEQQGRNRKSAEDECKK